MLPINIDRLTSSHWSDFRMTCKFDWVRLSGSYVNCSAFVLLSSILSSTFYTIFYSIVLSRLKFDKDPSKTERNVISMKLQDWLTSVFRKLELNYNNLCVLFWMSSFSHRYFNNWNVSVEYTLSTTLMINHESRHNISYLFNA